MRGVEAGDHEGHPKGHPKSLTPRLDELGAGDFLPDGIPDESPGEPDPRVFFDE